MADRVRCVSAARRTPPRQILEEALLRVAEDWGLFWINAADYKGLAVIEGCAHELAHALDLGPAFENLLQTMPDEKSNKHEASVLRIEVAALAELGVRLSMRRLRTSANWDGPVGVPSHAQLQASLNKHEQKCTKRFVALIAREIRRTASPSKHGVKHE
jgi:hypothetical protein